MLAWISVPMKVHFTTKHRKRRNPDCNITVQIDNADFFGHRI